MVRRLRRVNGLGCRGTIDDDLTLWPRPAPPLTHRRPSCPTATHPLSPAQPVAPSAGDRTLEGTPPEPSSEAPASRLTSRWPSSCYALLSPMDLTKHPGWPCACANRIFMAKNVLPRTYSWKGADLHNPPGQAPSAYQHVLRRAPGPHDENGDSPVHHIDEPMPKETGESCLGSFPSLHALHPLPGSQEPESHPRHGAPDSRPRGQERKCLVEWPWKWQSPNSAI